MRTTQLTRRGFLKRATLGGAVAAFPNLIPARVLGADGAVTPNNRINVAMIGTGRQVFYANLPWFLWSEDVQVVAVCDVDAWRMEQAKKKVEESYANKTGFGGYKGCTTHRDFREVLARKDVDAVMISTPDYWHACMAIAAAKAGKDIALEKPISLSVEQGRAIADAVKKHKVVCRTDTEVRSQRWFQQLCQVVRNRRIGEVKRVVVGVPKDPAPLVEAPGTMPVPPELDYELWQGPAPTRPYTLKRVHARQGGLDYTAGTGPGWFHISDYSLGNLLNWGTHTIDIAQWALDTERTGPVEVEGRAEFPKAFWDAPINHEFRYRYANGVEMLYVSDRPFVRVEGTEGWIENTWFQSNGFKASDPALLKWKPGANDIQLPCISEKEDFINCVRSRKEPIITAEIGHRAATICQIGLIAAKLGQKLKWDPAAEKFSGNDEANKLLHRPLRAPWTTEV